MCFIRNNINVYGASKAGLGYLQGPCYVVVVMKIGLVTLTAGDLLANLVLLKKIWKIRIDVEC